MGRSKMNRAATLLATLVATLCALLLVCPRVGQAAEADPRHGVVYVVSAFETDEGERLEIGSATGFFVGKGGKDPQHLVTAQHVVEIFEELGRGARVGLVAADEERIAVVTGDDVDSCPVRGRAKLLAYFDDSTFEEVHLVESDELKDIAIMRLANPTDKRARLVLEEPSEDLAGSSKTIRAVGYPGISENVHGAAVTNRGETDASVISGTVNRLFVQSGTGVRLIETDAPIKHGNSGGPVLNEQGNVIGVADAFVTNGELERTYYVVNIAEAMELLDRNNVEYDVAGVESFPVLPVAIAAVVVVAIVAVVLVLRKRQAKPNPDPEPTPEPESRDSGYRLQCVGGALEGKRYLVARDARLVLGRDTGACAVAFPAGTPGVSGRHCEVWVEHDTIYLQDLGSTHGTFVEPGTRIAAGEPVLLAEGTPFWLGSKTESFVVSRKRA